FGQVDGGELPSQVVRLINAAPVPASARVEICVSWLAVKGQRSAFEIAVPAANFVEFTVTATGAVRKLPPGLIGEDRALEVTARDQTLPLRALMIVNDSWPLLNTTPEKLVVADDLPHTINVENIGKHPCILQVSAAPWLTATPAELSIEPQQTA